MAVADLFVFTANTRDFSTIVSGNKEWFAQIPCYNSRYRSRQNILQKVVVVSGFCFTVNKTGSYSYTTRQKQLKT
jgi:hypothetical protein